MTTRTLDVFGVSKAVRRANVAAVLDIIVTAGPLSAREISGRAGVSKVTTNDIVRELATRGAVVLTGHEPSPRGPAAALYAVRPESAFVVGVTVGPRRIAAECVDMLGESRGTAVAGRDSRLDPADEIVRAVRAVGRAAALPATGVTDVVVASSAGKNPAFGPALAQRLGGHVDVRAPLELACFAEAAQRDEDTFVYAGLDPEPAVAAVVAGRAYLGPAAALSGRRSALPAVASTACLMFGSSVVVLGGDWSSPAAIWMVGALRADLHRRLGDAVRVVPGRAQPDPVLRGALAWATRRARRTLLDRGPAA